ncbi:MAG TPA: hypothetical protein VMG41_08290 [Gemmatimonadales bacterium]|nr:hypothetical protein [Gemmatimonadales bacterium]
MKLPATTVLAGLLLAGGRSVAAAQSADPRPPRADSTQTRIGNTILILRDDLALVDAAAARMPRDRQTSSDAVLQARARTMASNCLAASRSAATARAVVEQTARPNPDPKRTRLRVLERLAALKEDLDRCARDFDGLTTSDKAEELRDYGIGRAARVQEAIRSYEAAVRPYFVAALGRVYSGDARVEREAAQ